MPEDAAKLRWTLGKLGLNDSVVNAAWPGWWSDDVEYSASVHAELRFSLARKLGLDPRSLLEDEKPRFVWRDEGKFKHLSTESNLERAAISSFGASVGRALISGTTAVRSIEGISALRLRESILASQPFVRLTDLLALCWAVGIPVIHLRVFPLQAKRMCAMSVRVGGRFAILLGKDSNYPAPIAYYLAHELGHAAMGHLRDKVAVVDLQDPLEMVGEIDEEEDAADRYALELLTGDPEPSIATDTLRFTTEQLGRNLLETANVVRIEPGTLALCFGHSTGDWSKANAAMKTIYTTAHPVWREVNRLALCELDWSTMSDDISLFVRAVMGSKDDTICG